MPDKCCQDFWNRIPQDEPVFTIAARDVLAPLMINAWIKEAKKRGVNKAKIDRAYKHLVDTTVFQATNPHRVKLPD